MNTFENQVYILKNGAHWEQIHFSNFCGIVQGLSVVEEIPISIK